jgi:rhamnopyranosyl-N-acetylglucosaminyl-diphospho-decaprenol beta-1,3/1,4-galactofuranosyltransferase
MLIRKEVFNEVGLFDESFFMWAEETDFCLRTLRKGYKLYCAGKSKVWHKEGASTGKGNQKEFLKRKSIRPTLSRFVITGYLDIRNHIYFVNKHWGKFYMLLYILGPNARYLVRRILGIILYDDNKLKRIGLLFRGLIDGINKRMGKPKEL